MAADAGGEVVIVSPYVDAQTGSVVITIAQSISPSGQEGEAQKNEVALDVIVNHIREIAESVQIAGKGYGMVINTDTFSPSYRILEPKTHSKASVMPLRAVYPVYQPIRQLVYRIIGHWHVAQGCP